MKIEAGGFHFDSSNELIEKFSDTTLREIAIVRTIHMSP